MGEGQRTAEPSVLALAYLGDAEYERFVRRMLLEDGVYHPGELNRRALSYVTAERQAAVMHRLLSHLSEEERDVFRRARNHAHLHRPKHASVMDYRYATGLEAVLGMHSYRDDRERLDELLTLCRRITAELDGTSENTRETNERIDNT